MTREEASFILANIDRSVYDELDNEALDMAIKALQQESCEDVPDINDGNIYKCSCGYGWDKSKVVRHHFCPNCGRAVDNSIPCDDAVSRQAVLELVADYDLSMGQVVKGIHALPPVTPQYTEAEIQKMQDLEQAELEKAYKLGKAEIQPCDDVINRQAVLDQTYLWSKDEFLRVTNPFDYLRKRINSLPPVTSQPKTGRWIDNDGDNAICGCCSRLNHLYGTYCKHCGARMKEVEE